MKHRHTKGIVLDLNSEVCPESFLDGTKIASGVDVYRSYIRDSWVEFSNVAHSNIVGCDIKSSKIYDGILVNCDVDGAIIRGGSLKDCVIDADVVVGRAVLEGLTIKTPMRISTGYWTRLPRTKVIKDRHSSEIVLTESTDGYAHIECQRKPMRTWMRGAKRFQKVVGWSDETIDEIYRTFEGWLKDK